MAVANKATWLESVRSKDNTALEEERQWPAWAEGGVPTRPGR